MMTSNLFLTGRIKCGKSTLIKQEITPYLDDVGGYFVQRLFCSGENCGFKMLEIANREDYVLEKEINSIHEEKDLVVYLSDDGQWDFSVKTFEETGADILERAINSEKKLVLMDELGKVEQHAPRFRSMVKKLLDSPVAVLGVIKKKENPFLNAVRERDDLFLIDLDTWEYQDAVEKVRSYIKVVSG
jgi:nucleoside-triphosphatase